VAQDGGVTTPVTVTVTKPRRAGRRTNLALLAVLPVAFATGWLAFGVGTLWPARIVVAIHAVAGIAVVALVPWKRLVIRRGLARHPRRLVTKILSGVFGVLVLLTLISGFVHAWAGVHSYFGLTDMQVHVGAAVVAAPLFFVHIFTRRQRVRTTDLSRRNLLRFAALAGAGALTYAALEGVAIVAGLPGRLRRATGSYQKGTDNPAEMPYVAWLFDSVPSIDLSSYTLSVDSRKIGYAALVAGTDEVRAIIDCTGGWYAAQTWRGIRLDRLLPPPESGQVIVVTSATGYRRRFPASEASSLWLAAYAAGDLLDAGHGAPVRLVAPGRRGFWWVKWVTSVELEHGEPWWQPPFPLQ
jgi:DMSO/TMAO reductase YedYZ molybdopterin-dependent catalytic subunit